MAVEIVEVGPRDGLQNESVVLATEDKVELIGMLAGAGLRRIETASFVNPKLVPQMADGDAVMRSLEGSVGFARIGLALNPRGFARHHRRGRPALGGPTGLGGPGGDWRCSHPL